MAAGEYVSVSSQADTEEADLARERQELATDDKSKRAELASIYIARGIEPALAQQVADQLMAHDALGAHTRDELGISDVQRARPMQAAFASAGTFSVGAAMPLLSVVLSPGSTLAGRLLRERPSLSWRSWGARGPRWRHSAHRRCRARNLLGRSGNGTHVWRAPSSVPLCNPW